MLRNTFLLIQDGGHVLCIVLKFETFPGRFAYKNVANKAKMDLVTLIGFIARNFSKLLMLQFMS